MENNIPWDLIISKLRQNLSEKDENYFQEWLNIGCNRELFRELEIVWKNVQEKSAGYEPDVEYYWKQLSAKIHQDKISKNKKVSLKINFRYLSRIAVAASIALILSFSTYYFIKAYNSGRREHITYSTQNNKSTILLPDSSEVMLHANTILTYNSDKTSGRREVDITGEAYFKVKHDQKVPFIVHVNGISIKVHGTEFNVCSYSSDDKILVSLIEGSISMNTPSDKNIFLKPGEEAAYSKNCKTLSVAKGDMDLAKIWTGDRIRFEDKSLHEVCKYLSKWYGISIRIEPDIVENQSYTFTVTGQPLSEIIEIMSSINSFDHYFITEKELVLKQKTRKPMRKKE